MKLGKLLKYALIILVIIGGLTWFGLKKIAPGAICMPFRHSLNNTPADRGLDYEELTLNSSDGTLLKGYKVLPKDSVHGVMILVHGIGGCKEHFIGTAEALTKQGIVSYLFDNRAHGRSGGKFCTYGYHEKEDIAAIIDRIEKDFPDAKIGIWGNSLGGAIAIQALEYDKRLSMGIIESTFTDLEQIVYDYSKRIMKGFSLRFITDYALKEAGQFADFEPHKVKPLTSVRNIKQPVLIAHGDKDLNISYKYGESLYKNLASERKEFHLIQGAGHSNLYAFGGEKYYQALMAFTESNLLSK